MLFGIWLVFKTVRSRYTSWSYFRCDISKVLHLCRANI
jgi:hypothetical protein